MPAAEAARTPLAVDDFDPRQTLGGLDREYTQAHGLALGMLVFSFVVLLAINLYARRDARVTP